MSATARHDVAVEQVAGPVVDPAIVERAERMSLTSEDLIRAVVDPESTWAHPDGTCCVRGKVGVVVDEKGRVRHLLGRKEALRAEQVATRHAPRSKGPAGRRSVTTASDLCRALREHGFDVDEQRRHLAITHPDIKGQATAPRTPSDHRSIPNSLAQIKRTFGVDVRE